MVKTSHLLILVLCALSSFAQKTDKGYGLAPYKTSTCKSSFNKIKLEGEIRVADIQKYLQENNLNLKDDKVGLKLNYVKESPGGFHYSFTQTFDGVEVYHSEVKVNMNKKNVIHSVFDNSENTSSWNLDVSGATESSVIAIHPKTHQPVVAEKKTENQFFETLRVDGEIIFQHDLRRYFAAQDSLVRGKIFNPDPLTTAHQFYNTNTVYHDNNDLNATWMDAEYDTVSFRVQFQAGEFSLVSDHVRVSDFAIPLNAPAKTFIPEFYFDRSQSGFEDVNSFYHIGVVQSRIEALGFDCADGQVEIDPHGWMTDNSFYTSGRIQYGIGGVDDAEDADVVVHEYGHFVSDLASLGSNIGDERNALDEGFGDYLAASYSKSIDPFNNFWFFNWDGHNEFWSGRVMNSTDAYSPWVSPNTFPIYKYGSIWASALYAIHNEIGRDATDSLILETHYNYAQNISMPDGAQILIDADTTLYNGHYFCTIYKHLLARNLVSFNSAHLSCLTDVMNLEELNIQFFPDGTSFTLLNANEEKLQLQILNINGQLISDMNVTQPAFHYRNENLPVGIYLVALRANDAIKTFKWCKAK